MYYEDDNRGRLHETVKIIAVTAAAQEATLLIMRSVLLSIRATAFRITRSVSRVDIHNRVARISANNRELCRSGDKIAGGGFLFHAKRERAAAPPAAGKPPSEKAIAFHRRPTFALFHLPPAGEAAPSR